MQLDNKIKNLIIKEYEAFKDYMYANSPKEVRDELGQFFTPASLTTKMIECYKTFENRFVLDATSGSGNLLAGCIIAGCDPSLVFGNDYDARMVKACRERIKTIPDRLEQYDKEFADSLREKLKQFNDWQIHRGDATDFFCIDEFGPDYKDKLIDHWYEANPIALMLDPDHKALDTWLSQEQVEFLKEVD